MDLAGQLVGHSKASRGKTRVMVVDDHPVVDQRVKQLLPAAVFLIALAWMWAALGSRFVLLDDEGIYLDGAARIVRGEVPYKDFFVLTGPFAFWLRGALLEIFGATLAHARFLVCLELALSASLICWLAMRLTTAAYAAGAALCFLAFTTANTSALLSGHRWDSSILALLAVAFLVAASDRRKSGLIALAGGTAALAAWATPSVLALVIALGAWVWWSWGRGRELLVFASGIAGVSAVAAAALQAQGALLPMLEHMLWSSSNYMGANRVAYGSVNGGYGNLFSGVEGVGLIVTALIAGAIILPAVLPLVNLAGWGVAMKRALLARGSITGLLLLGSYAMVLSTYPRWDANHLSIVAPVSYVLVAALLARVAPGWVKTASLTGVALLACLFTMHGIGQSAGLGSYESRIGHLRIHQEDATLLRRLEARIQPGDSLFVFPYMPILYFATEGINVTRFTHLQPGMMNDTDELAAIEDLRTNPPQWVLYADVSPEAYLKMWPSSEKRSLRMERIENHLTEEYAEVERYEHSRIDLRLLTRRTQ